MTWVVSGSPTLACKTALKLSLGTRLHLCLHLSLLQGSGQGQSLGGRGDGHLLLVRLVVDRRGDDDAPRVEHVDARQLVGGVLLGSVGSGGMLRRRLGTVGIVVTGSSTGSSTGTGRNRRSDIRRRHGLGRPPRLLGAFHPHAQLGQIPAKQMMVEGPGVGTSGDLPEPPPVELAGEGGVLGGRGGPFDPGSAAGLALGGGGVVVAVVAGVVVASIVVRSSSSSSRSIAAPRTRIAAAAVAATGTLGKVQRQDVVGKHLGLQDDKGLAVGQPRDDGLDGGVGQHPHQAAGEGFAGC